MPRPSSPQTTFVCEFQSLNSHLVKISCVCMIIGLAVGAIAVAEPKPQADPTIPRDELKKLVAAALADRYWARSDHPIPAARMERMEYVGAKSQQLNVPQQFISGDAPVYPIGQLIRKSPGAAVIGFTIDEQGNTRDFVIVGTTYHFFATHAIRAVQDWKFEPARKSGKPVAVKVRASFVYAIR
jgi:TonB family protein